MGRAAAAFQQADGREVGQRDEHARPQAEGADTPTGLGFDHAANGERLRSDSQGVTDGEPELIEQLGCDQYTPVGEQAVLEANSVAQSQLAVQREAWLDRAQFDHAAATVVVRAGAHHGREVDGLHTVAARA
jgi:hypothetical protein